MSVYISLKADFNVTVSSFDLRRSIAFFCSLTVSSLVKSKMCLTRTRVKRKENVIASIKACASFLLF